MNKESESEMWFETTGSMAIRVAEYKECFGKTTFSFIVPLHCTLLVVLCIAATVNAFVYNIVPITAVFPDLFVTVSDF